MERTTPRIRRYSGELMTPGNVRHFAAEVRLPEDAERGAYRDELHERVEWLRTMAGRYPVTGRVASLLLGFGAGWWLA